MLTPISVLALIMNNLFYIFQSPLFCPFVLGLIWNAHSLATRAQQSFVKIFRQEVIYWLSVIPVMGAQYFIIWFISFYAPSAILPSKYLSPPFNIFFTIGLVSDVVRHTSYDRRKKIDRQVPMLSIQGIYLMVFVAILLIMLVLVTGRVDLIIMIKFIEIATSITLSVWVAGRWLRSMINSTTKSEESLESEVSIKPMDPATILQTISASLKLIEQFRSFTLKLMKRPQEQASIEVHQIDNGIQIKQDKEVLEIKENNIQLNEWDAIRYHALDRRINVNWRKYNGMYEKLPTLSFDEQLRAEQLMADLRADLCMDFREILKLYERTLGIRLQIAALCDLCDNQP